jgi:short-subunit dehydrogenase
MMSSQPVAFITGASSGIGSSLAMALVKQGYRVALFSRNKYRLIDLQKKIQAIGGEALILPGDVTVLPQITDAWVQVKHAWHTPDLVVANAGVCYWTPTTEMDIAKAHQTITVNLIGLINTVQTALPHLIANHGGHIVGIASLASYRGFPRLTVYSASKAGVVKYLEGVRVENREKGIVVTTICPGFIKTPMVTEKDIPSWAPKPFLMDVEESTKRIVKAIQKKKSHYAYPLPMALLAKLGVVIPNTVYDKIIVPFSRWFFSRS